MIDKYLDSIDHNDIESLITNEVKENRTIEYKEQLPDSTESEKKEFLADISSFANASGGDIIYGISEQRDSQGKTTGIPEEVKGLSGINTDAEIRRLENIIRDGIAPRINGIRFKPIDGFSQGKIVLLIRVPKSWSSPHMVTFKNNSRFYARNNTGKYQLDVTEIRSAFLLSESRAEKIQKFRDDRIAKIIADETSVQLQNNAKAILHLVPIGSLDPTRYIDITLIERKGIHLKLIHTLLSNSVFTHRYNFDGYLAYTKNHNSSSCYSYIQLFRNGAIEIVSTVHFDNSRKLIFHKSYEKELIRCLTFYVEALQELNISLPIFVMPSLIGVKSYKIKVDTLYPLFPDHPIDRDVLLLPDAIVEEYNFKASDILRPAFDTVWQSAGWDYSRNYNQDGSWMG